MNQETKLQRRIMLALSSAGCLVFRNETAGAWMGRVIHNDQGSVTLAASTFMKFGLCAGSSDIIGLTPSGKFLAVEVKTKTGVISKQQQQFIDAVNNQGGVAFVARTVDDALKGIE